MNRSPTPSLRRFPGARLHDLQTLTPVIPHEVRDLHLLRRQETAETSGNPKLLYEPKHIARRHIIEGVLVFLFQPLAKVFGGNVTHLAVG
jgi:hypothetical protein